MKFFALDEEGGVWSISQETDQLWQAEKIFHRQMIGSDDRQAVGHLLNPGKEKHLIITQDNGITIRPLGEKTPAIIGLFEDEDLAIKATGYSYTLWDWRFLQSTAKILRSLVSTGILECYVEAMLKNLDEYVASIKAVEGAPA